MRSTKIEFDQNSVLQAARDTSIARVTGYVYPRKGYRSATPLLFPPANAKKCKDGSPICIVHEGIHTAVTREKKMALAGESPICTLHEGI